MSGSKVILVIGLPGENEFSVALQGSDTWSQRGGLPPPGYIDRLHIKLNVMPPDADFLRAFARSVTDWELLAMVRILMGATEPTALEFIELTDVKGTRSFCAGPFPSTMRLPPVTKPEHDRTVTAPAATPHPAKPVGCGKGGATL